jgi:integrase
MAKRESKRLTPPQVAGGSLKPGRHADGDNLYLVVDKDGAKRWVFIYRWREPGQTGPGRLREMGLGSLAKVSLAKARSKAADQRGLLGSGVDPIAHARKSAEIPTFGAEADRWSERREGELKSKTSKARIKRALEVYAKPLRGLRVDAVETHHVVDVLEPLWTEKPETAHKLRGYIEAVLDAAKVRGHRTTENPARWRGHLSHLLAARDPSSRGHHAALPYAGVSEFMRSLRSREAVAALALEFLILTAARSGEVIGATWAEIDLKTKVWTVPPARMKGGREHRVPLSGQAVALLEKVKTLATGDEVSKLPVFPGPKRGKPLSSMALAMLLRRMKVETTVHGFRSSFRDWAGEVSTSPREVAEAALAHTVGDATERAYRRGDVLEKRRMLMEAWAAYVEPNRLGSNVLDFGKGR